MATTAITLAASREDHIVAAYAALAIVVQLAETAIPAPLPGVKPGLANVVTLLVLLRFGWTVCAEVTLLRVLGASLLLGSFGSPGFILSLSGALASVGVLRVAQHLPATGPIGLSVLGALAHVSAQFVVVYFWLIPNPALLSLLPILLSAALGFGILNGIIVATVLQKQCERHE